MSVHFQTTAAPTDDERALRDRKVREAISLSKVPGADPGAVAAAWREVSRAIPGQYTINSVGLWRICEIQTELEMQKWMSPPDLPLPPSFGLPRWPVSPEERETGETLTPAESAFFASVEETLEADSGFAGIPSYKIASDDNWMTTPREIREALDRYTKVPQQRKDALHATEGPWWQNWIDFLTVAAQRGGFRKG